MRRARLARRELLTGASMLVVALPPAPPAQAAVDYAIFSEFSPADKQMKPGWNRRIFTDTEARRGNGIQCDMTTGIVSLAPGTWRIAGYSMTTYNDKEPPEMTTVRAPAAAGYCRLRTVDSGPDVDPLDMHALANDAPGVICIGSTSTANMTPSLFDAFYETDKPARLVLEHQSGSKPDRIFLRVYTQNSRWHAFARLTIQKL